MYEHRHANDERAANLDAEPAGDRTTDLQADRRAHAHPNTIINIDQHTDPDDDAHASPDWYLGRLGRQAGWSVASGARSATDVAQHPGHDRDAHLSR
ncbi:MAG: hypothetical protein ABI725_02980 [Chloroflexota bacterium]